jgi:hypothetical protein
MRLAIKTAAGSRARDTGVRWDFGVRTVARLADFPTIISPISTLAPGRLDQATAYKPAVVFNLEDKIANRIVNNIESGYHLKKRKQK